MPIVLHELGYPLYKKPPVVVSEEDLTEEQKAAREAEKVAEAKKKKKVTKKPEVDAGKDKGSGIVFLYNINFRDIQRI